jgi:hypothetical protein
MPEGTVFFPPEPILRVTAPLPQAQLVETRPINLLHFQTLVADRWPSPRPCKRWRRRWTGASRCRAEPSLPAATGRRPAPLTGMGAKAPRL